MKIYLINNMKVLVFIFVYSCMFIFIYLFFCFTKVKCGNSKYY